MLILLSMKDPLSQDLECLGINALSQNVTSFEREKRKGVKKTRRWGYFSDLDTSPVPHQRGALRGVPMQAQERAAQKLGATESIRRRRIPSP